MATDSVKISLELATQAADIALKNFKKNTEDANSAFNIFKGSFAAGLALDSIKASFGAIAGFIGSAIGESSKAEQSVKNMNVALQNAGLYSDAASKDFQAYADELEKTTAFSGEAAESSITLFASLTTLSKDGIKQATTAAADLAATLNVDMATASDMIAKAINGNVTGFNKLGIEIQKGRTDSENLANTLKALSSQQGAAAKSSETFAGSVAKLENQKGKLLESIGDLITKNPLVVAGINGMTNVFISLSDTIQDNTDNLKNAGKAILYTSGIVVAAGAAWVAYTALTGGATVALGALGTAASIAWTAITGPVGLAVIGITALGVAIFGVIKYWDEIRVAASNATAVVLEYAASSAGVFNNGIAESLKAEAQAFRDKANAIQDEIYMREALAIAEKEHQQLKASSPEDLENEAKRAANQLKVLEASNADKVAARRAYKNQLLLLDQEFDLLSDERQAEHERVMFDLSGVYDGQRLQKQLDEQQQRLLARQQFETNQLNAQIDADRQKALLIEDSIKKEKALQDAAFKANLDSLKLKNKQELDLSTQKNRAEQQLEQQKIANKRDTFNSIMSLQSSSNKELAAVGKAFALYDIGVNTAQGVMKAWGLGPIIGPPAAALVAAAGASQAAQVAGLRFATGGIVPGNSFSGDRITAGVNSREMVLNVQQQKRLFEIADGSRTTSSPDNTTTNLLLSELIEAVKSNMSININGREIISVLRDGFESGRTV